MKVFALTLLSLAALSQARLDYKLQCTHDEISIRWPSYHSNSEYYVCQGINGNQLTVHCPPGEVFTFVLQQCSAPALYVPAPPIDFLPTTGITTHFVADSPPVIASVSHGQSEEKHEHPENHVDHEHKHESEPESVESAMVQNYPIPPTPAPAPPTPPTVVADSHSIKKPVGPPKPASAPKPASSAAKKTTVPKPGKSVSAAKKTPVPVPAKAAKKPAPPRKAQKNPSA